MWYSSVVHNSNPISSDVVDFVKEIRGSCCCVLWPLEGTDKPYISSSLGPVVSRLFEHEELAKPLDTGHYVVATRLFHQSWAKWDAVLCKRANLQSWLLMAEPPSRTVPALEVMQLMERNEEVSDIWEDLGGNKNT